MLIFLKVLKLGLGIFALVTCTQTSSVQKINYKYITIYDLPRQSELEKCVLVLKNITNFYLENINKISISVAFGIFIGNGKICPNFRSTGLILHPAKYINLITNTKKIVHLGHALRYKKSSTYLKADLMDIFMKSEEILNFYQKKIADEESGRECVKISQLFSNATIWIARVAEYRPPRVDYIISRDFQRYYQSWSQYSYVANVRRANRWIPSPKESDYCLKLLAGSDTADSVCLLDDHCSRIVQSGSDIGYALCHRALLLLMARNSKACSILPGQDSDMLDSFCSMSYAEAEYIAHHDFGLVDLMLEHISLCVLHGRTEFLRRTWLNNILEFQTAYGCFSQSMTDVEDDNINDLLEGRCSGHTTALTTSVLAGAARFILELY